MLAYFTIPKSKFNISYILITLILSVILLRIGGYYGDFDNYFRAMRETDLSLYYLREPVFWLGSRFLYDIIGISELVIIFYDIIFILCFLRSFTLLKQPRMALIFFSTFPVIFGLENVYRQLVGLGFFLMCYACSENKLTFKALAYLFLAILSHNLFILFTPVIFRSFRFSRNASCILFIMLTGVFAILTMYGVNISVSDLARKGSAESTGADLRSIYALLQFGYVVGLFFVSRYLKVDTELLFVLLFYLCISSFVLIIFGSAQSERVMMICLFLSTLSMSLKLSLSHRSVFISNTLPIFLVLPIFAFSSGLKTLGL